MGDVLHVDEHLPVVEMCLPCTHRCRGFLVIGVRPITPVARRPAREDGIDGRVPSGAIKDPRKIADCGQSPFCETGEPQVLAIIAGMPPGLFDSIVRLLPYKAGLMICDGCSVVAKSESVQ